MGGVIFPAAAQYTQKKLHDWTRRMIVWYVGVRSVVVRTVLVRETVARSKYEVPNMSEINANCLPDQRSLI